MIALDTSRLSEGKLPFAESHARAFGAEILLLHVMPVAPPASPGVTVAESQALTYLNTIAARLRATGVEAHSLVRYGNVAEVIVREAELQHVDLVIIGNNVRRGLPTLFVSNIAADILAHCHCPVLVVPPNLADAEKPLAIRNFDEDVARTGPVAPRALGLRTVAITRVVGSVGRSGELDGSFRVRHTDKGEVTRYERIKKLMAEGVGLPPVALYKLGYGYYVLDGNHRVAAARELGQLEIDAEVTEFVPLEDPQTQRVFLERRSFEQATGLTRVGASSPGSYPRMATMVRTYARQQGTEDMREAARMWEAKVYRPAVRRIRALRLGHLFPDHRTADVFVEIAEFRDRESEREGAPLDWDEAILRYRDLHRETVRT
ncbi:MAG: universal stress protein [Chloroflexota bacterium]